MTRAEPSHLPPGLVDRDLVERAMQLAQPAIEAAIAMPEVSGLGVMHVLMIDPAIAPLSVPLESAILFERSIGDRARWDVDYREYALQKAGLAWRLQCDSALAITRRPHRLVVGDSILGGAVCVDGLVAAASGAHPWFDEACARTLVAWVMALARQRAERALAAGAARAI